LPIWRPHAATLKRAASAIIVAWAGCGVGRRSGGLESGLGVIAEESDEKSNERFFLGAHKLGKFGSGLFLKPLWASCELKFGRKRLRVGGDEVKQQVLYGVEPFFARALLGTNRTKFKFLVPPRGKRSFAEAKASGNLGQRPTG